MGNSMHHITICICTYKRPALLKELLQKLFFLRTGGLFTYSVVVVDNDRHESARPTVESLMHDGSMPHVRYIVQPEQNISLTRNCAVENGSGDYLAFIDDDEFPEPEWLLQLYLALQKYGCDGVLGPVRSWYGSDCPRWLAKARLCERGSHPTGTVMGANESRTGNLLLKRSIFADPDNRFEQRFGRTGGEDVWFFVRVMAKGYTFVWCEEAPVHEIVTPERWKASYYFRRSIRLGGLRGKEVRSKALPGHNFFLVLAAGCAYLALLPISLLVGKHLLVRYLAKSAYHLAWVSGYLGYVPISLRDD